MLSRIEKKMYIMEYIPSYVALPPTHPEFSSIEVLLRFAGRARTRQGSSRQAILATSLEKAA